jgi:predicted Fe-Mo cluster-binding NifX family protein
MLMKIAVTAQGPSLDGAVDPRFGRSSCFLIVETEDLSFEAIDNPNLALGGGAGVQSAQFMADKGVKYVLTGNCGPNAYRALAAAGMEVIVGCSGRIRDVVEQFKAGTLSSAQQPNVASHFGMGGAGSGMGMGMGRGQGMGGGRGMGPAPAPGVGGPTSPPQGPGTKEQLSALKQQAEAMADQMRQIQQRIEELEQQGSKE